MKEAKQRIIRSIAADLTNNGCPVTVEKAAEIVRATLAGQAAKHGHAGLLLDSWLRQKPQLKALLEE
jgi:coenzyme F420-reducing hydrogenase gamma subunit